MDSSYQIKSIIDYLYKKMNIEDSIISSIMFGCLPGIIKNLDEYKQIKCAYVACLEKDVQYGQDPRTCDRLRNRLYCKYVVGEVFMLTPLALWASLGDLVKRVLSSPLGIVDIALGLKCAGTIAIPHNGILANLCLIHNIAGLGLDIYDDLTSIKDKWKIQNDYCDKVINENE